MKPDNVITVEDWMKAEAECFKIQHEPQPKGSILPEQYSEMTNRSVGRARVILCELWRKGLATREHWKDQTGRIRKVYYLKKK